MPKAEILKSKANSEGKTRQENIEDLGKNLANEIEEYIFRNCDITVIKRISFIGFSLGGIIIRSALPKL